MNFTMTTISLFIILSTTVTLIRKKLNEYAMHMLGTSLSSVTVTLKCKLTVPRVSIFQNFENRFLRLSMRPFVVSSKELNELVVTDFSRNILQILDRRTALKRCTYRLGQSVLQALQFYVIK